MRLSNSCGDLSTAERPKKSVTPWIFEGAEIRCPTDAVWATGKK
jgi:hypothetical protein